MKKNRKIKILVVVLLVATAILSITLARQIRQRQGEVWLAVYSDLDYARRFRLTSNEYSYENIIGEHNHNLTTNIDEYTQVTFTLDENYVPKEGELFFYPSERTSEIVDKFNEYLADLENPVNGYDGTANPITLEYVIIDSDAINEIIGQMIQEASEDIFN